MKVDLHSSSNIHQSNLLRRTARQMSTQRRSSRNASHKENLKEIFIVPLEKIGHGTYSTVLKGYAEKKQQLIAIKITDTTDKTNKAYIKKYLPNELILWKELSDDAHENILLLKEHIRTPRYVYAITDLMTYGDLGTYIFRRPLSHETHKGIAKDIAEAIFYCHSKGIAHRDIKLENILVGEGKVIKLADFSFATRVNPIIKGKCGTKIMLAPEQCTKKPFDPLLSDIWQLGLTFYAMLFKTLPYKKQKKSKILKEIENANNCYKWLPIQSGIDVPKECKDMLCGMLNVDPSMRLTAKEVKSAAWFDLKD